MHCIEFTSLTAPRAKSKVAPAINARVSARPRPQASSMVFDGIGHWPNIDTALHEESVALAKADVRNWSLAGGIVGPDGEPTLGAPSSTALKVLGEVIGKERRFRYCDAFGVQWGVQIIDDLPESWQGLALGLTGSLTLLDHHNRTEVLRQVSQSLAAHAKPGQTVTPESRKMRARLSSLERWLTRLNMAATLVAALYDTSRTVGPRMLIEVWSLAADIWSHDEFQWPSGWRADVFDAVSLLGNLEVQSIGFPKVGWRPEPLTRQSLV